MAKAKKDTAVDKLLNHQAGKGKIGQRADNMRDLIIESVKVQKSTDKAVGTVSNKLLVLAQGYQKKDDIGKVWTEGVEPASSFMTACKGNEDYIKSNEAGTKQVDKLPRCWTQAKSNIKAGFNYGLNLKDYTTESALRKDVMAMRKKLAGTDPLKAAIKGLTKELDSLPADQALDLLNQINELAKEAIAALVPDQPIKLDAEVVVEEVAKTA